MARSSALSMATVMVGSSLLIGSVGAHGMWRKNPIPMCNCDLGVGCSKPSLESGEGVDPGMLMPYNKTYLQPGQNVEETCGSDGLQFATSWEDGYGGYAQGKNVAALPGGVGSTFSMVDQLRLPEGISGDYILSWRWDCEHTPQIWSSCSDITIEP